MSGQEAKVLATRSETHSEVSGQSQPLAPTLTMLNTCSISPGPGLELDCSQLQDALKMCFWAQMQSCSKSRMGLRKNTQLP